MPNSTYDGPSVFGYETDVLNRAAAISVHSSPLANLGSTDAGGMNVYVRELSHHIAATGLPIDVFTRRTDLQTPEIQTPCDGVRVVAITAGPPSPVSKYDLFQYMPEFASEMALFALRDGIRYDIMHAHYWLSGWVAQLAKRYWSIPYALMFHTTAHMKNAVSASKDHEPALRGQIERRLVGLADSIIAGNPDERADLIWRQRAVPEKICTIPPGVDTELFRPLDRRASRAELGLAENDAVVTFVGRVDPIKGIDTLVQAIALMDGMTERELVVQFVGGDLDPTGNPTGPLAKVAQQLQDFGVDHWFRLVGSQPQDRLPVIYSSADLVCVPSRYESFGLVAVEAMACGVPVVASRAGGLVFSIDEGETGFLVPANDASAFADAMTLLLNNPELAEKMGTQARKQAHRFAWPVVAQSMRHVYQRLAEGHRADLCCDEEIYA